MTNKERIEILENRVSLLSGLVSKLTGLGDYQHDYQSALREMSKGNTEPMNQYLLAGGKIPGKE